MNPLTNVRNTLKLNERMLDMGVEDSVSWHKQYKDSAYIFIGGLPYGLTEGDILCVFSQYGEIVNINLVRDSKTGETKGFCFLCYEDQRSTILAVDNFNGIKLGGRTIRVDHCSNYRRPKSDEKDDDGNRKEIIEEGCAPKTPSPSPPSSEDEEPVKLTKKKKKDKKAKKNKKDKEHKPKAKPKTASSGDDSEADREQAKKRKLGFQDKCAELAGSRPRSDDGRPRRQEKHRDPVAKDRDGDRDRDNRDNRDPDDRERNARHDQRRRDFRDDRRGSYEHSRHPDRSGARSSQEHNERRNERHERDRPRPDRQDRDYRQSDKDRRRP